MANKKYLFVYFNWFALAGILPGNSDELNLNL